MVSSAIQRPTLERPVIQAEEWARPSFVRRVFGPPVRRAFLRTGRHAGAAQLTYLCKVLSYLEAGHWLASEQACPEIVNDDGFALFGIAYGKIFGRAPLYLEFGVFEGRMMRWWSQNLTQPSAKLVGFDSFEGLPEDWRAYPAGSFQTNGPPRINDSRVSFQIGWFEETLHHFTVPDHDQIILNVDCDLYSSTSTVLRWAQPYLRPGSLIYFDEFVDRDHEMKAFNELCASTSLQFKPVAIANGGSHWLFETS